jgi:hypothetical protein
MRFIVASLLLLVGAAMAQEAPANPLRFGREVPEGAVGIVRGKPVPLATYIDELLAVQLQPEGEGWSTLAAMEQDRVVIKAAQTHQLEATEPELDARIERIAEQMKAAGSSLEETLKARGVEMPAFRARTRSLVLLEKLAQLELKLPAGTTVENHHGALWLKQALSQDPPVHDAAALPSNAISRVAGSIITRDELARELMATLPARELLKAAETLVQLALAEELVAEAKIEASPADFDAEWTRHARDFESKPEYKGVAWADLVKQRFGQNQSEFMAMRAFRVRVLLSLLSRKQHDETALAAAYEAHRALYGPVYEVRHIYLRARAKADPAAKIPTFEDAEARMKAALTQLDRGVTFQDLVSLHSEDLQSRSRGGMLEAFTPGRSRFPPEFAQALETLEVGAMTAPFKSAEGWHVLRLEKKSPPPALEAVREDLYNVLGRELFRREWQAANIGIDIKRH